MELAILLALYFLPSICAMIRGSNRTGGVIMLNLLLGWTVLFWLLSLVWAFGSDKKGEQEERITRAMNRYK